MEYAKNQDANIEMPDGKTMSKMPIGGIVAETAVPLAKDKEWSSDWFDITAYGSLGVSIASDKEMELHFEYSADEGTNKTILQGTPAGSYTDVNNINVYLFATIKAKYFRFRAKNISSTAQENLSINIRAYIEIFASAHTVSLPVFGQQVALVSKALLEAPNGTGVFGKIGRIDDALKVYLTNPASFPANIEINNFPLAFQVSNFPASFAVSNFPNSQNVSGTVAVSNVLNPHPVSVSNPTADQLVHGTVAVNNLQNPHNVAVQNFPSIQSISGTVSIYEPPRFSAVAKFGSVISTPQDIVIISGAANKIIKVQKIVLSASATLTALTDVLIIRRPSVPTSGSPQTVTAAPFDTNNSASATVKQFTANPTSANGTLIYQQRLLAPALAALVKPETVIEFKQGVVLRSAADTLAINLNGVTIAGLSVTCTIEWTEE